MGNKFSKIRLLRAKNNTLIKYTNKIWSREFFQETEIYLNEQNTYFEKKLPVIKFSFNKFVGLEPETRFLKTV